MTVRSVYVVTRSRRLLHVISVAWLLKSHELSVAMEHSFAAEVDRFICLMKYQGIIFEE